jgi:sugar O-acyltransferase (sialic acid O-acetyltransferase NeuD family)
MYRKKIAVIGYSGHAYVIISSLEKSGSRVLGYFDKEAKAVNPFELAYLGSESDEAGLAVLKEYDYFISIGDNIIRRKVQERLSDLAHSPINVIDPTSSLQSRVELGSGVFIAPNALVNSLSVIGNGVVCNSGSVIEHECFIDDYAFISPGAVVCGNVRIGKNAFIGANATIKQGVKIGDGAIVGAGSVVIGDIEDNMKVVGNPHRIIDMQ